MAGKIVINVHHKQKQVVQELCHRLNENMKNVILKNGLTAWFQLKVITYGVIFIEGLSFVIFLIFNLKTYDRRLLLVGLPYLFEITNSLREFFISLS